MTKPNSNRNFLSALISLAFAVPAFAQQTTTTPATDTAATGSGDTLSGLKLQNSAAPQPTLTYSQAGSAPSRPGAIRLEPIDIFPILTIGMGRNDNVSGTATNQVSSSFLTVSPQLRAVARKGAGTYSLAYAGKYDQFWQSSADNANQHELDFSARNQLTSHADIGVDAFYMRKVDPRGTIVRPVPTEPDQWNSTGLRGQFGYGAAGAKGRIEVDAAIGSKKYQNNRSFTEALDVDTNNLAGRFLYRVAPKTQLLFELNRAENDYKTNNAADSTVTTANVGARWNVSGTTKGQFTVGRSKADLKNQASSDSTRTVWDLGVTWTPRTYSSLTLAAGRATTGATGVSATTVDTKYGATWQHSWSSRVSTTLTLSSYKQDFVGTTRSDRTDLVSVGAYYDLRRWMRVGVEALRQKRDSSDPAFNFTRNGVFFTVGIAY